MIQADALKISHVSHGFFTREGGHSRGLFASLNCGMGSGDDTEIVRRNRAIVADALNVAEPNLISAYQVHSPDVIVVEGPWPAGDRPRADGMVTAARGLAIGVLTADCGPILFADAQAGVIGAAHGGWKGALAGVTGRTLDAMERLGAKRARTVAVVGPMISGAAYEVGPEFPARFLDEDGANKRFFTASARPGHGMFDLAGYLEARLKREGAGKVVNLGLCTFSDEARFFSYRRATHRAEKDYGRQISAIALS
ncbi:MAG: peptidoglycan editing factor PgeF [Rhizobiales bacterium]|nr:peptidoglycan editing factor PgeF [Hyphomicrobiales bacterium]